MGDRPPDAERTVWQISALIHATEKEADQAAEAIGRALCPDPDHQDPCPVPWTLVGCRFDEMDDEERASWQAEFEEDRHRAAEVWGVNAPESSAKSQQSEHDQAPPERSG
jgi:hypothetical protein